MNKLEYWIEALESSLEEHEAANAITSEQAKLIAEDMLIAAEMYGEASGQINIRNPLLDEFERNKERYQKAIVDAGQEALLYRRALALKLGVEAEEIYIHGGAVKVSLRRG